jgi:hypothetical protein
MTDAPFIHRLTAAHSRRRSAAACARPGDHIERSILRGHVAAMASACIQSLAAVRVSCDAQHCAAAGSTLTRLAGSCWFSPVACNCSVAAAHWPSATGNHGGRAAGRAAGWAAGWAAATGAQSSSVLSRLCSASEAGAEAGTAAGHALRQDQAGLIECGRGC